MKIGSDLASLTSVYFDTNAFIYLIDGTRAFRQLSASIFSTCVDAGVDIRTSELSLAECLIKPKRQQDTARVGQYRSFFEQFSPTPIAPSTLDAASTIAADRSIKLIDAIHVATALELRCDGFLTNDEKLANRIIDPTPILLSSLEA
ncbi:MAG: PIN domain-containing protein [Pseudomonadota bacterium]